MVKIEVILSNEDRIRFERMSFDVDNQDDICEIIEDINDYIRESYDDYGVDTCLEKIYADGMEVFKRGII